MAAVPSLSPSSQKMLAKPNSPLTIDRLPRVAAPAASVPELINASIVKIDSPIPRTALDAA